MPEDDKKSGPVSRPTATFEVFEVPVATTATTNQSSLKTFSFGPITPTDPLEIVEYELGMFFGAIAALSVVESLNPLHRQVVKCTLVESSLLHVRNLCEIFLDKGDRHAIKLGNLLKGYGASPQRMSVLDSAARLGKAYGRKDDPNSPWDIISTMVMHASKRRSNYGVYDQVLRQLLPRIVEIKSALETLVGKKFKQIQ
jgi:hypothetical protein